MSTKQLMANLKLTGKRKSRRYILIQAKNLSPSEQICLIINGFFVDYNVRKTLFVPILAHFLLLGLHIIIYLQVRLLFVTYLNLLNFYSATCNTFTISYNLINLITKCDNFVINLAVQLHGSSFDLARNCIASLHQCFSNCVLRYPMVPSSLAWGSAE